jgi:hypothetical protein
MRTIFPAQRPNLLLDLESHILQKIARAAASIGVLSPVAGAASSRTNGRGIPADAAQGAR